jgi:pimeloyl-ACP methyl ester carboxylesterase
LPKPGLRQVAACLLEGTAQLGLDRPALCGTSAGAPYALALAVLGAGRFRRLALLSGVAEPEIVVAAGGIAAFLPRLARARRLGPPLLRGIAATAARPRAAVTLLRPLDLQLRRYLTDPDLQRTVIRTLRASLAQGVAQGAVGLLADVQTLTRPWGFVPNGMALPTLILHGRHDWVVPVAHAHHYRVLLPQAECLITEDEHVSAAVNHRDRLLAWLTAD